MSSSKIRIKFGSIEIDYEGSDEFLKAELPALLGAVASLHAVNGQPPASNEESNGGNGDLKERPPSSTLSTNTICAKIGGSDGPSLIQAAIFKLMYFNKEATVTRKQLTAEMRTATNYFKSNYVGNLTAYIKTLLSSGKLLESSPNVFSLHANTMTEIEAKIRG